MRKQVGLPDRIETAIAVSISALELTGAKSLDSQVKTPKGWDSPSHEQWVAGKQQGAIQTLVNVLNQSGPQKTREHFLQLAYYFFLIGDTKSCFVILKQCLQAYPNDIEVLQNLAVAAGKSGLFDEAIVYAKQVIDLDPDNFLVWDALASNYHRIGQYDLSSEAGTASLTLKDKKYAVADPAWTLPSINPRVYAAQKSNVMTFALWGNNPRYLYGALRNVLLAPDIYPDWQLWFYVDSSVPIAFRNQIEQLGGKILLQPDGQSLRQKLCWRFKVANTAGVGYFLVRDVDSVISVRECNAVQQWLESDKWFHIIRDWWTHTDLILAGLWGGVAGVLPNLEHLLATYVSGNAETPNVDQWFLRDRVWRYVKQSCFIHDRCFKQPGAVPLPGPCPGDRFHVGCIEYSVRPEFQRKILAPWFAGQEWG